MRDFLNILFILLISTIWSSIAIIGPVILLCFYTSLSFIIILLLGLLGTAICLWGIKYIIKFLCEIGIF